MEFEIFEQVFNWNVYTSICNSWVYNQILKSVAEVNLTSQFKSAWTSSSLHVGSALYGRFKQNQERWWTLNTGLSNMLKSNLFALEEREWYTQLFIIFRSSHGLTQFFWAIYLLIYRDAGTFFEGVHKMELSI
jgi:hypothetical protein